MYQNRWLNHKAMVDYYGYNPKNDVFKSWCRTIENFFNGLNLGDFIDNNTVRVAAYGSLLNENDYRDLNKSIVNSEPEYIYGYRRIFNMGNIQSGAFLNIEEDKKTKLLVNILTIKVDGFLDYVMRESLYNIIPTQNKVLTVIGQHNYIKPTLEPQLNYLHLCLSGILRLSGIYGINSFLDTSYTYSPKHKDIVSIREYLKDLDLTNYLITHNYSSR